MWLFVLCYLSLGLALAAGMMAVPALRLSMKMVARRLGMPLNYARTLWLVGTIVAWPVGLYVLSTGRLVLPVKEYAPTPSPSTLKSAKTMLRGYAVPERSESKRRVLDRLG